MMQEEQLTSNHTAKLNWLRAGVLGANDGIVSIAGLVVGVAGATGSLGVITTAGIAGIVAGAISMAAGEYVSVSSSRDTEHALLRQEKKELEEDPKGELEELVALYQAKGLKRQTAETVAKELTVHDAFAAHVDAELNIDPDNLTNPTHAAIASAVAFTLGGIIPLLAILLPSSSVRVPVAFVSVLIALIITGTVSARIGKAHIGRAVVRVVAGGVLAMLVTYGIGVLFHLNV